MGFGIPMVWREAINPDHDCYFSSINVTGVNKKKRKSLSYDSFPSTIRPVLYSTDNSIPKFKKLPDVFIDEHSGEEQHDYKELSYVGGGKDFASFSTPVLFNQQSSSDLIRDLSLSQKSFKVLASRLKDQNLLQCSTKIIFIEHVIKSLFRFLMMSLNLFSVKIFLVH